MKTDPVQGTTIIHVVYQPPLVGPGSGREAWIDYAFQLAVGINDNNALIEMQSAVIRELEAELTLLRREIASRKPTGGRPRLPDERVTAIEAALATGVYSARAIAVQNGVSAMTVSRVARRAAARRAATEAALASHTADDCP